jgi:adenylate kinase family enzyme
MPGEEARWPCAVSSLFVRIHRMVFNMNIAENIFKHSLENVYFLVGSACGGKTTMAREIAKKHGLIYIDERWQSDKWNSEIINPKYQPNASKRKEINWEAYFSRSVGEFLADKNDNHGNEEYLQFLFIELVKASQNNKVITDIWITDYDLLLEIATWPRIACLLAPGEIIVRDYYDREEHMAFTNCIKSLNEPEVIFATQNELFRIGALEEMEKAKKYNLFSIMRNDESTVEGTLKILEEHFKLN